MIGQKNFIRVANAEPDTLCISDIVLRNGRNFRNYIYDDKATPIAGFLPIRATDKSKVYSGIIPERAIAITGNRPNTEVVYYVNTSEIAYMVIDDNNANEVRRDMFEPFTEKRISDR